MAALTGFICKVVALIIQPLIVLIVTAGVAYFIWGIAVYMWNAEKGDQRSKGTQHMLWGVIGIVIMVAIVGILQIVLNTFHVQLPGGRC
jgi:uncharacterized membrane protein YidH (DUF202 family)